MNIERLLKTQTGQIVLSMILGLGLASLFYKACNDKNCLTFAGPILSEVDGKIYKHEDECYKYKQETVQCDSSKKIVPIMKQEIVQ